MRMYTGLDVDNTEALLVHGASDDLVEYSWLDRENDTGELGIYGKTGVLTVTTPSGARFKVTAQFGADGWELGFVTKDPSVEAPVVEAVARPDYPEDPAMVIHLPVGSTAVFEDN